MYPTEALCYGWWYSPLSSYGLKSLKSSRILNKLNGSMVKTFHYTKCDLVILNYHELKNTWNKSKIFKQKDIKNIYKAFNTLALSYDLKILCLTFFPLMRKSIYQIIKCVFFSQKLTFRCRDITIHQHQLFLNELIQV